MTTEARVLSRPGPWSRIVGLGTIYGKTVRDSWRAALVIGGVLRAAAPHGIVDVVSREPNLEDVFLAQYGEHPVAETTGR